MKPPTPFSHNTEAAINALFAAYVVYADARPFLKSVTSHDFFPFLKLIFLIVSFEPV